MGVEFSTDFTSLNRIELSWFVQVLSNFYWFQGSPGGWGGRWVDRSGDGYGCVGVSHACMHAHTHMHACMHTSMHAHACCKHDKHGCLHVSGHLQISIHVYVCMHACACVGGHPHALRHPPPTWPPPQSCREPKTPKFNKSWTNGDNSILFEDSLPVNTPELI